MQDELAGIRRELRWMKVYALVVTSLIVVMWFSGFRQLGQKQKFEEIDAERINIVEKDGKLRMVIANKERTPGPVERGVPFAYGSGRRIGMIFYNDESTECGGLAFGSSRTGSDYEAGAILAFDQYDEDQAIALQHYESNSRRYSGLSINEYPNSMTNKERSEKCESVGRMPEGPGKKKALDELSKLDGRNRVYLGRTRSGAAMLSLADPAGNDRLRLRVDTLGAAHIEFLNDTGKVVRSIPE